jgi:Zn-dependent protease/CBS domain-containing protein
MRHRRASQGSYGSRGGAIAVDSGSRDWPRVRPGRHISPEEKVCVRALRLIRIAGIDVFVDWSLLIIFAVITLSLAEGMFPSWHPDWSPGLSWMTAVAAAVLFFTSVLIHELSHALVGRAFGVTVRRITLFVFGGMAEIEHEPRRWQAELWMAVVGPIASLVIGAVCLAVAVGVLAVPEQAAEPGSAAIQSWLEQLPPVATLLLWLGQVNIMLAMFNLVPAFPLDGGRVLRALLWAFTGDVQRATRWASGLGRAFAWVLIASGLAMILGATVPVFGSGAGSGIWLAFIGWFLHNAALVSYRQVLVRDALHDVSVSKVMLTRFDAVSPQMSLTELLEDHVQRSDQRAFPVIEGGHMVGLVCQRDLEKLRADQRGSLAVRDIMKPAGELTSVDPRADAMDVLTLLARRDINQVPVIENGQLAGLVRRADILRWLAFHHQGSARRS